MMHGYTLRILHRLLKYSLAGGSTFLLDLALLSLLTHITSIETSYLIFCSFLLAVSVNYYLCYTFVYRGTERRPLPGYAIFIVFAALTGGAIVFSTTVLSTTFELPLLGARIIVGILAGLLNFVLNTFFNFKLV